MSGRMKKLIFIAKWLNNDFPQNQKFTDISFVELPFVENK